MTRVLLIGSGPLPSSGPRELGFPQLRTRQFLRPLVEAGHEVLLASLVRRDLAKDAPADASFQQVVVHPDEPGRFLRLRDLRREFAPEAVVTAGPFLPMAGGARAVGDEPLWVDVPGDPMAEAQAKALRSGSPDPIHRYRQLLGLALARGDRFSVISRAQRGTLIGALGLAGRLTGEAAGQELVHVVRGSVDGLPSEEGPSPALLAEVPADARVVLFCGGYNNWLDGDTQLLGLLRAMDADPSLHYVSTGGGLPGHDDGTFSRFRAGAEASPHAERFHFLGWISLAELPAVFARARVTVSVDRPCYEAEFGARTRVLESLERGVPVVTTDLCELTHELVTDGLVHPVPVGDPGALAEALLRVVRDGADVSAWERVRPRYGLTETTRPLLDWVASPQRSPKGDAVDFLDDSWQELARLQDRLEEVWKSPTWRTLGRLHKALDRLRGR